MQAVKRQFKVNLLTKKIDLWNGMKMTIKMSARAYKKFKLQMS